MFKIDFQQMYAARAEDLAKMRADIRGALKAAGVEKDDMDAIVLAISEGCMNVIQHAYHGLDEGMYEVTIRADDWNIEAIIADNAPAIDVNQIHPRSVDELRPGGLGVYFIHQIMDEVKYKVLPNRQGNLLSMKKSLAKV